MSVQIKPKQDRVLIKELELKEQKAGNIIIPDAGKEKCILGTVVAVGPGIHLPTGQFLPNTTQVGTVVGLPKFGPISVSYEGQNYIIARESEILFEI